MAVVLEVEDVRVEYVGGAEGGTPPTLGQWITVSTDFMLSFFENLMYFIKIRRRG